MVKIVAFAVLSAGLVYISRASLLKPRSHGFFRFFAWEAVLALFLLNVDDWFRAPLSGHQIMSWLLLTLSIVPLVCGVLSLRGRGKPVARREGEPHLLAFEKTSALVSTGIYRYIRHPLYSSLLFLTWGAFYKAPSWAGAALASTATLFLIATAKADEAECIRFFGPDYRTYMGRTRMFVPFFF
jgi:protein-S-isoprenylcysteine O-methyltransferase Ste14